MESIAQVPPQFAQGVGPAVGHGILGLRPYPLIGIEFRGIRREIFQVQALIFSEEFPDHHSLVGRAIVPDNNNRAAQMPQKIAEEAANLFLGDVFPAEVEIKSQSFPMGADGNAGDDRKAIMELMVMMNGGSSPGRPSLAQGRDQEKARLVNEHEVGAQLFGVFFIRGHCSRFHFSMAASSLSRARFWGFCQLKPRDFRSRPIWSRWYWTPNLSEMISAIRAVVQRSVRYPLLMAPWMRILASRCFCLGVSLAGRPGTGIGLSPASPRSSRASRQRLTEIGAQFKRRPTSLSDRPESKSSIALSRRFSNCFALPYGRMKASSFWGCSHYNITYADVNNLAKQKLREIIHLLAGERYCSRRLIESSPIATCYGIEMMLNLAASASEFQIGQVGNHLRPDKKNSRQKNECMLVNLTRFLLALVSFGNVIRDFNELEIKSFNENYQSKFECSILPDTPDEPVRLFNLERDLLLPNLKILSEVFMLHNYELNDLLLC
jgi:hypothetical protein